MLPLAIVRPEMTCIGLDATKKRKVKPSANKRTNFRWVRFCMKRPSRTKRKMPAQNAAPKATDKSRMGSEKSLK